MFNESTCENKLKYVMVNIWAWAKSLMRKVCAGGPGIPNWKKKQ